MPTIALQQVSSEFARENAGRTLEKPIALRFIERHLQPDVLRTLQSACPDGTLYVWGARAERSHQTVKMLEREAMVFFRRGQTVFKRGVVIETAYNESLAEALWGRETDCQTWPNVFFFATIKDINIPASRMNELLGRSPRDNWQGLVVLPIKDTERVRAFFAKELGAP